MPTVTTTYPTLQTVMDAVRLYQNDWQAGATSTPGEGQITTNTSPQVMPALNAAIREMYRKLRNVGSPTLIRDNVLIDLPANGATGPSIQTYLSQQGYFDGLTLNANPKLPSDLLYPLSLMEQQTGNNLPFVPMVQPQGGLPTAFDQGVYLQVWEWRGGATFTAGAGGGDALWFVGAIVPITIRIRYQASLTQFTNPYPSYPLDFTATYVPLMDCEDYLALSVAFKISRAISGMTPPVTSIKEDLDAALFDLQNAITRRAQEIDYHRQPYASQADDGAWIGTNPTLT